MSKKGKVFVGVSGGVDSSVALALLQKDGYDVTGVFLKVWHPEWLPCDWKEERRSAMRVCATLGVPFITMDCEKEYKEEVVDYMIREYSSGRVPNPDVFCNKYVKFGVFLDKAKEMGADFVATGHYAICAPRKSGKQEYFSDAENILLTKVSSYSLLESVDKEKDQSYFLYTLNQEQLAHTLFPIGHLTKPEVRKLARKFGLPTAEKKDSQGLCFIGKVDMKDFLSHYIDKKPGNVLDIGGRIIGYHEGVIYLTIGQRHGFTITKKTNTDPRYFIVSKDLKRNTITVASEKKDLKVIYSTKKVFLTKLHLINEDKIKFPLKADVRIRYRQVKQKCTVEKQTGGYSVTFAKLQNAISVGQSAVLYRGDVCLGGGIIEKTS